MKMDSAIRGNRGIGLGRQTGAVAYLFLLPVSSQRNRCGRTTSGVTNHARQTDRARRPMLKSNKGPGTTLDQTQ